VEEGGRGEADEGERAVTLPRQYAGIPVLRTRICIESESKARPSRP
jgi:hypothetical protein